MADSPNIDISYKAELKKYAKRFKEFPPDHALEAFKKEYYLEAVGVLHGFIESQMRSILHAYSTTVINNSDEQVWDINEKFDFKNLTNILFVLQIIKRKEYDQLFSLNSLRNEIIHKYFYDPFDHNYIGASKKKFLSIFKPAYDLSWKLNELNEKMYMPSEEAKV